MYHVRLATRRDGVCEVEVRQIARTMRGGDER